MEQPQGYNQNPNHVCKLNKEIYGLKQAPRVWFDRLKTTLFTLGYQSIKSDNSLFVKFFKEFVIYILIYVDNLIILGNDGVAVNSIIHYQDKQFSVKDLGDLTYFLGIEC